MIPLYVNRLSKTVKHQDGFLNCSSFWNSDKTEIYSMSDWKTVEDWKAWYYSPDRKIIRNQFLGTIDREEYAIFYKQKDKEDLFLL